MKSSSSLYSLPFVFHPAPGNHSGMYRTTHGRKGALLVSIVGVQKEKSDSRRGIMSTRYAPGSKHSEKALTAASATFTKGSSCSLTGYP